MAQLALTQIFDFLPCETPDSWVEQAQQQQSVMLIDHAHCEKKAALTAIHLMHRYPQRQALLFRASRLAREELRHFEQVLKLLERRDIKFVPLAPSRYATGLRNHIERQEPQRLIDLLIIAAFIEARSCERFHKIAPHLDDELRVFYQGLFAAEARHFKVYLQLAEDYATESLTQRIAFWAEKEQQLIETPDPLFRFHSGVPDLNPASK
ncbi:MAG: tRNA-(ms[2]io[6]A)-hydroxylase [Gammaproteobacteria bacterium]|nr:tRNA-(ms[2]io[6]A)-hydroxylase [Gammaproteobacteria bacterium]